MKSILTIFVVFLVVCTSGISSAYVIDHNSTNISQIPESAINAAKTTLHIAYGHTSHGSQLTTGMTGLVAFANGGGLGLALPHDIFAYNNGGTGGALDLHDYAMGGDCGYYPQWVNNTRNYLTSHPDTNVIIWSWCGQVSGKTEQSMIDTYLAPMTQLELDYPNVTFVYMTGHSDGSGESGNLHLRNQQIRDYCIANNKVLYDFYDIETYDPDNNYYGDKLVNDGCNYDSDNNGSRDANWATAWQNSHTEGVDWYSCSSAHSEPLNANRKAYAAWWLWARIAGWSGSTGADTEDPTIPQNLNAVASSHSQINLTWNTSTDNVAVTGYRIYRDGSEIATTAAPAYNNTGLTASSTHSYTVLAYDAAGNESAQSGSASATTLPTGGDTEAPTVPQNLDATIISATAIDLSWDASTDNTAVTGYKIFRNGTEIANSTTTTYRNNGLTASTTYTYRISAYDTAGNLSAQSSAATSTTPAAPDTEAPTIPQDLNANVISANVVDLSWDDSSDNTAVIGYRVYYKQGNMNSPLDGTGATEGSSPIDVGDVITTSVSGLDRDTVYYFAVTAYDAAGNESQYSTIVSNQWMPELLTPLNGAVDVSTTSAVRFQWSDDAEQMNVTYTLYYSTDPELGAVLVPSGNSTQSSPWNGTVPVTTTLFALSLLFLLSAPKTGIRYKYILLTLSAAIVLTACGGSGGSSSGGGSHSAATVSVDAGTDDYHSAFDLDEGTTYYWRVIATDTNDSSVTYTSETYHFTTD
ncbi:MAG: fibronectin type III domain-containing protein [Desulfuromusa sp.]